LSKTTRYDKHFITIHVPPYDDLEVQNGTMALDVLGKMMLDEDFDEDKEDIRKNLLAYCELDTLAMLEFYKKLK